MGVEANSLFQKANTNQIQPTVCQCLKDASIEFEINTDKTKQLSQLCNISLSVSIDPSIDCNT